MTMSKQDFEMIAERIYSCDLDAVLTGASTDDLAARTALAGHFADSLHATNGMFKREKFIRACTTGAGIRRSILPRP